MSLGAQRQKRRPHCMGLSAKTWTVLLGAIFAQGLAVVTAVIWVMVSQSVETNRELALLKQNQHAMAEILQRYDNSREAQAATQERLAGVISQLAGVVERLNAIERKERRGSH